MNWIPLIYTIVFPGISMVLIVAVMLKAER